MKKVISFLISFTMLFGMTVPAYANNDVRIKVDGKELTDAQAILQDGTTLLPVRSVSTALGGEVMWDNATKSVTVLKDEKIITAIIGEKFILENGSAVNVSTPAQVIDGRTYIPLRVMGEALDCNITWVNETKTVEISNSPTDTKTSSTVKQDLFGDTVIESQHALPEEVYMKYGEIVLLPVEGNWVYWSDGRVVECDWSQYNGQNVIVLKGLKKGSCTLKIYESDDRKGEIQGDYREVKVYVVDESSREYIKQKAERVASGFDIIANQTDLITREDQVVKKYGLQLENFSRTMYTIKDGVLIIPINSTEELTGTFYLRAKEGSINAVMDRYNGKPAIFIKQEGYSTDVILRYVNNNPNNLEFEFIEEQFVPSLLWEREEVRTDPELKDVETAVWAFSIGLVSEDNKNYIMQEKARQEKGISYDLYLNGQA